MSSARWNFGDFELDAAGFQLLFQSHPVKLERIPLELMIFMVERQGQLVSRDEIATRLWGNGVHVDVESGVNTAIRKLRAALKDSPEAPVFIETLPGKGYRFIGRASRQIVPRKRRPAQSVELAPGWSPDSLSVLQRRPLAFITPAFGPLARPLQRLR